MNYSETIDWLFRQFPAYHLQGQAAYNPGLKNTAELVAFFGNPHEDLRFVHVGGTNGKGSTSNMLASILMESGEKVGLFTSPHLFDFTERIRINGVPISETFVIEFCRQVREHEWQIAPSFFEITWTMALAYFKAQGCTIVIAEVGLGGRLDATNIITPLLSIITNIGLDHTHLLGDTRAIIAGEKAGIIKTGIPVILGENDSETFPVFERTVEKVNSSIIPLSDTSDFPSKIFGYQKRNYLIVKTAAEYLKQYFAIDDRSIQRGIDQLSKNTGFIGRLEVVSQEPLTIVDCAHNAEGVEQLLSSVPELKGDLHILYGTSSDKDISSIKAILPQNAQYYFTTFNNPRSADLEKLKHDFENFGKKVDFFSNPKTALKQMQASANKADTCLIFGSFFLIHDFFEVFFQKTLAETK